MHEQENLYIISTTSPGMLQKASYHMSDTITWVNHKACEQSCKKQNGPHRTVTFEAIEFEGWKISNGTDKTIRWQI